jgi:4a-hydroxytetrahydrobiopterin dehydratase
MAGRTMRNWSQRPDALERDFEFTDFAEAMAFVNRVAGVAVSSTTTPDILVHGTRCG